MTSPSRASPAAGQPLSLTYLRTAASGHHATWVRVAIWIAVIGYAVSLTLQMAGKAHPFPDAFTDLGALVASLAGLAVLRAGRTTAAIVLVTAAVWLELNLSVVFSGMDSGAVAVLPVFVAATGLLLGARSAMVAAGISAVSFPLAVLIGSHARGQSLTTDNIDLIILLGIVLIGMAILVWLFLRSFGTVLDAALASERHLADLFRHAPVGIIAVETGGRVEAVNPAAERLLGAGAAEAVCSTLEELLAPRLLGAPPGVIATLARGDGTSVQVAIRQPDGRTVPVEMTAKAVPGGGGARGIQVLLSDITERLRGEEEQRSLQTQLQHAQKMEAVGRLAGGVAHDFNNLLMAVGASAELLALSEDEETRELAELITKARDRGARLTRQLLTFARKDVAQPRTLAPGDVIHESEPLLRGLAGDRVRLELRVRPSRPIVADPGQFEQVLLNLVANARDAMPDGGVLSVEAGDADDAVAAPTVSIRVRDTGAGMSEATRAHLFEPFFTTKPPDKGTGLGLSTVHGIVTQSGGRVEVESVPGKGSCFTILWPAAPSDAAEERATRRPLATGGAAAGTVLLVEDDDQTRALVRLLLERDGYTVIDAPDGDAALGLAAATPRRIDLVLSDVVMPGISGVELARRLRLARPDIAVLLMSGYLEDPLLDAREAVAQALLLKPFTADELRTRIAGLLAARRTAIAPDAVEPVP